MKLDTKNQKMITLTDMPIFAILLILEQLATTSFVDFYTFFKTWSQTQKRMTVRHMLSYYPTRELYRWGKNTNKSVTDMLLHFMEISGSYYDNTDALFFTNFRIILQRNIGLYNRHNESYETLCNLAENDHTLSSITTKVLDIYYCPEKRAASIDNLIEMLTKPDTAKKFPTTIQVLRTVAKSVWPNHIFTELYGPSICNQHNENSHPHFVSDGMPIQSHLIYDYACPRYKVAIIVAYFADLSQSTNI